MEWLKGFSLSQMDDFLLKKTLNDGGVRTTCQKPEPWGFLYDLVGKLWLADDVMHILKARVAAKLKQRSEYFSDRCSVTKCIEWFL